MSSEDKTDYAVTLHHETAAAILVSEDDDEENAVWLPKSQIEYETNHATGMTTVSVPEWLAIRSGLA